MTFPFGLEALPPWPEHKDDALFFANRALEALYRPERVLDAFAAIARDWPEERPNPRLVMAHDGALRPALEARAAQPDLAGKVRFVGRLDAATQAGWYAQARWYLSLPASDSVSVSVLEAMGHGCIPILSDLPANRELVRECIAAMNAAGIKTSLFIDPDAPQIELSAELGAPFVELHTGAYAQAYFTPRRAAEFERLRAGAELAHKVGLTVNAGHGINYENIAEVRTLPHLHELNIGHSIVSRAITVGLDRAVAEMLALMAPYRGGATP